MSINNLDNQPIISHQSNYFTIQEFNSSIDSFIVPTRDQNERRPQPRNSQNVINDFGLIHMNARSINANFDKIELLFNSLSKYKFSIIGITETWLHSNSPPVFDIKDYSLLRADRQNGKGGGVAFYVHNNIRFKIRHEVSIRDAETLFIELINDQGKNIIVGLIYRPPSNSLETFFEDLDAYTHSLSLENKHVYLMGDFNINLYSSAQAHEQKLNNILSSYALYPHINKPTRITNTTSSLIDNIFSNNLSNETLNGILFYDISDHLPIFMINRNINLSIKRNSNEPKYRRIESENNIAFLNTDLAHEEWHDVLTENDINKAYDKFLQKLLFYYEKNIPQAKIKDKKKQKSPWITKGILRSIHHRNQLYKLTKTEPCYYNINRYKKYRNKLTTTIRLSRKMHYSNEMNKNKNDINTVWKLINDLIGKNNKADNTESYSHNNEQLTNPTEICDTFNKYFTNIGPKLAEKIKTRTGHYTNYLPPPSEKSLFFKPTNIHEILDIVRSLKPSKSTGCDGISVHLLKNYL